MVSTCTCGPVAWEQSDLVFAIGVIGWWFVNVDDFHEGWVPATYLEPLYGSEDPRVQKLDEEEVHITLNAYEAQHDDEVSFEKGVLVEVFEKGMDGWWKIR